MTVLDAHMHITDCARFDLAWTRALPPPVDPSAPAYARACAGTGIDAAVIVETDVTPEQRLDEARFQSHCVRRSRSAGSGPFAGGVPCLDLREPDGVARIEALAGLGGIVGVRWMCRDADACAALSADALVRTHLRRLGACGLSFDLHLPPDALLAAVPAIAAAPDTRIALNHCGHGDPVAFGAAGQRRAPRHDPARWRGASTRWRACRRSPARSRGWSATSRPAAGARPISRPCSSAAWPPSAPDGACSAATGPCARAAAPWRSGTPRWRRC